MERNYRFKKTKERAWLSFLAAISITVGVFGAILAEPIFHIASLYPFFIGSILLGVFLFLVSFRSSDWVEIVVSNVEQKLIIHNGKIIEEFPHFWFTLSMELW